MENWVTIIFTISLCVCLAFLFLFKPTGNRPKSGKKGRPPPSPPSVPIVSNLLWQRLSLLDLSPTIRRLSAQYGPIVSLNIGPFPAIYITERRLAHEALVVKGAAFVDRPTPKGAKYIDSSDGHVIAYSNGALWRLLRRNLSAGVLHPARLSSFAHGRRWVLGKLLGGLRVKAEGGGGPVELVESFRNPVFSLLVYMCFGEKLDDTVIESIKDVQRELVQFVLKLKVFDQLPRLGKLIFRKRWKAYLAIRRRQEDIFIPLIRARRAKKLMKGDGDAQAEDTVVPYVDTLLELELPEDGGRKLDDLEMVSLCSEFFNVGTDGPANILQWAMANLVKYPHIQKKLFEEIREVTGDGGGDMEEEELKRMDYLKAVVLETLRRHAPAHFLLPHKVSEEVCLDGYLIRKGAVVNVTTAEFGWDEKVWKDPMEFRPERFLPGGEGHGVDVTGSREIMMIPFGAGRRMCPGHSLAISLIQYFLAHLVREFEWKTVEGEVVDLTEEPEFTMTMKIPLRAWITPRQTG